MTSPTPTRLPITGGYQMTLHLLQGSQRAAVVLGAGGHGGPFMVQSDAQSWVDGTWAAFRPYITNNTSCVGATVRLTQVDGGVWEFGAPASPQGGNVNGQALAAACWLLKWQTATGGRSGKGRTFLPGLPSSQVAADGRSYVADAPTNANAMITAYLGQPLFQGAGIKPSVLSFRRGVGYPITSGSLGSVVGIQRRRMRP